MHHDDDDHHHHPHHDRQRDHHNHHHDHDHHPIEAHIGPPETLLKTFALKRNANENYVQNRFRNCSVSPGTDFNKVY